MDWSTYKEAALAYSLLKPRVVRLPLTILAGEDSVALPAGVYSVLSTTLEGESLPLDILLGSTDRAGWSVAGNGAETMIVVNAPVLADTTFTAVCRARHLPDEDAETFPTIPAEHTPYVEMLERAIVLEAEADEIERGPVKYVIGQSTIDRTSAAAGLRGSAAGLRQRVFNALVDFETQWG